MPIASNRGSQPAMTFERFISMAEPLERTGPGRFDTTRLPVRRTIPTRHLQLSLSLRGSSCPLVTEEYLTQLQQLLQPASLRLTCYPVILREHAKVYKAVFGRRARHLKSALWWPDVDHGSSEADRLSWHLLVVMALPLYPGLLSQAL